MGQPGESQEDQLAMMLADGKPRGGSNPVHNHPRSTFIPRSDSPGPAAYGGPGGPEQGQVKTTAARTVFGSSSRDKEANRYISALHSAAMPPEGTPGPGTYRVLLADKYPHSPKRSYSPTWKFGSAPQRADDEAQVAARSPGPVYSLPEERMAGSYTFAPMGNPELGALRSRDDTSGVYISAAHSQADRTTAPDRACGLGPGAYEVSNQYVLSPKKKVVDVKFGTANKDAKNSYNSMQMAADPGATSAVNTPGAIYDVPSPSNKQTMKFGTGPRTYSPERGGACAGPYLSKLHEHSQLGTQSPGPGTYAITSTSPRSKAVAGWLGDAPTFSFGSGPQSLPDRSSLGPGPGAYRPRQDPLSRSYTAPSFTCAPALRTDMATMGRDPSVPGPGTYDIIHASTQDAKKHTAAAYTMCGVGPGGRNSFVTPSISPGPAAYGSQERIEIGPGKGYSFGMKERTVHERSTVSVRYHGPLASQEGLGTQSPGPGLYDVRASAGHLSPTRRTPDIKFGSAARSGSRAYISKLHAEAEGSGLDSPGPGAYNHGSVELASVTSKYRKPPVAAFSSSPRFTAKYMTF